MPVYRGRKATARHLLSVSKGWRPKPEYLKKARARVHSIMTNNRGKALSSRSENALREAIQGLNAAHKRYKKPKRK